VLSSEKKLQIVSGSRIVIFAVMFSPIFFGAKDLSFSIQYSTSPYYLVKLEQPVPLAFVAVLVLLIVGFFSLYKRLRDKRQAFVSCLTSRGFYEKLWRNPDDLMIVIGVALYVVLIAWSDFSIMRKSSLIFPVIMLLYCMACIVLRMTTKLVDEMFSGLCLFVIFHALISLFGLILNPERPLLFFAASLNGLTLYQALTSYSSGISLLFTYLLLKIFFLKGSLKYCICVICCAFIIVLAGRKAALVDLLILGLTFTVTYAVTLSSQRLHRKSKYFAVVLMGLLIVFPFVGTFGDRPTLINSGSIEARLANFELAFTSSDSDSDSDSDDVEGAWRNWGSFYVSIIKNVGYGALVGIALIVVGYCSKAWSLLGLGGARLRFQERQLVTTVFRYTLLLSLVIQSAINANLQLPYFVIVTSIIFLKSQREYQLRIKRTDGVSK